MIVLSVKSFGQAISFTHPYIYYNFDESNRANYAPNNFNSDCYSNATTPSNLSSSVNGYLISPGGIVGNYLTNTDKSNTEISGQTFGSASNLISLEMLVRFQEEVTSVRDVNLFSIGTNNGFSAEIVLFPVPVIRFYTDGNLFQIDLDGQNRKSLDYYFDKKFHHFCFKYDADGLTKQVWVDGECPVGFSTTVVPVSSNLVTGDKLTFFSGAVYERLIGDIDEIALWKSNIPATEIYQHYLNATNGRHYQITTVNDPIPTTQNYNTQVFNTYDFAAGQDIAEFPGDARSNRSEGITKTALQQLQYYPLPRFKVNNSLPYNANWMACRYLGGNYQSTGTAAIATSFDIQKELANYWHFYFNVTENPASDHGGAFGTNDYTNTSKFAGYWINELKANWSDTKNFKYAALILRAQLEPNATLNNGVSDPFVTYTGFTNQPVNYMMENDHTTTPTNFLDANGNTTSSKKYSFAAPMEDYDLDGIAMSNYLQDMFLALNNDGHQRTIGFIGENNEYTQKLGGVTLSPTTGYPILGGANSNMPKSITRDRHMYDDFSSRLNTSTNDVHNYVDYESYQACKKMELDQRYRDRIMSLEGCRNAYFLNYAVDGNEKSRWQYKYMRNTQINAESTITPSAYQPMPTPDIYPASPASWRNTIGARHSWQWIANSLVRTLKEDDKLMAPFVSAGYFKNELYNIRPGQYLGLLKCLTVAGAQFYQPGFFNIDGVGYNVSENKPANPKGYVWQASIPIYAQAISSYFEDILNTGILLEGDMPADVVNTGLPAFSFKSNKPNHLICIRKDNSINKYVITGTIQVYSNEPGNALLTDTASIILENSAMKFPICRQGSTYIYDKSNTSNILFYQIDGWHSYKHPEWWNKDFIIESELADYGLSVSKIKTIDSRTNPTIINNDFTHALTYVKADQTLTYYFDPRAASDYYFFIKARKGAVSTGTLTVQVYDAANTSILNTVVNCINTTDWRWYYQDNGATPLPISFHVSTPGKYRVVISSTQALELDKFILSTTNTPKSETLNPQEIEGYDCTHSFNIIAVKPSCHGGSNGSITINNVLPTGSYTYSKGSGFSGSNSFTGLTAGTYTISIRDASLNITSINYSLEEPDAFNVVLNPVSPTCKTYSDGRISANIIGGTEPYTYLWSGGQTTAICDGLPENDTHTITVTDNSGCSASSSATTPIITNALLYSVTTTPITCNNQIQVVVSNGVPYYSVSIDNGLSYKNLFSSGASTTFTFSNLKDGDYPIIVKDNAGCKLSQIKSFGTQYSVTDVAPSCPYSEDGQITVSITTTGSYTFNWYDSDNVSLGVAHSPANSDTWSGLAAGTYKIVIAGSSCTPITVYHTLLPPAELIITPTVTPVSCGSTNNGSISLATTGGFGTITYLWNTTATSSSITSLSAGSYSVNVLYGLSPRCIISKEFIISNDLFVGVSKTDACGSNGSATVIPSGSGSSYTYLWSNSAITQSISGLVAGAYTCTVTSSSSCTRVVSVVIESIDPIKIIPRVVNDVCNNSKGAVFLDIQSCNSASSYLWSNSATTRDVTGLVAGTYTVTVTDVSSNTFTMSFVVTNSGVTGTLGLTLGSISNESAPNAMDGSMVCTISGGKSLFRCSTDGGITYMDPKSSPITINNLSAKVYDVYVIDAYGCLASTTATVPRTNSTDCLAGSTVTNLPAFGTLSSGFYKLNSDITIASGSTLSLSGVNLVIAPGKKIIVSKGAVLEIKDGSYLHGCAGKWQGIVLNSGLGSGTAPKVITTNYSQISDATIAIEARSSTEFNLTKTRFDNNSISISAINGDFSTSTITGCTFDYSSLPFNDISLPDKHIYLDRADNLIIGGNSSEINKFNRGINGIRNENSTGLVISNNLFDRLGYIDYSEVPYTGISVGCALSSSSTTTNSTINFHDNTVRLTHNAILASGDVDMEIIDNSFEHCFEAIWLTGTNRNTHNILGNKFYDSFEGIHIFDCREANVQIKNNHFNMNESTLTPLKHEGLEQSCYTAINVSMPAKNLFINLDVNTNEIADYQIGVHLRTIDNSLPTATPINIENNNIYFTLFNEHDLLKVKGIYKGIWIESCNTTNVISNDVSWTVASGAFAPDYLLGEDLRGIDLRISKSTYLCSNNLINVGTGVRVEDNCDPSYFWSNTLNYNYDGFKLVSASIFQQGASGVPTNNTWNNITNQWISGTAAGSPADWWHAASPANMNLGANPFSAFAVGPQSTSSSLYTCTPLVLKDGEDMERLLQDSSSYLDFVEMNKSEDKMYAYSQIKLLDEAGEFTSSILDQFVEDNAVGNYGMNYNLGNEIAENDLAAVASINSSLITNDSIWIVNQLINDIYLSTDSSHHIIDKSYPDYLYLSGIAHLSPFLYGSAIYSLRAMMCLDLEDELPQSGLRKGLNLESTVLGNLLIYPQPTNGIVSIKRNDNSALFGDLQVLDLQGRILFSQKIIAETLYYTMDLSKFDQGCYLIRLIDSDTISNTIRCELIK